MPKQNKADEKFEVSANEAWRRKEVALAGLREMEADEEVRELVAAEQVKHDWATTLAPSKRPCCT